MFPSKNIGELSVCMSQMPGQRAAKRNAANAGIFAKMNHRKRFGD